MNWREEKIDREREKKKNKTQTLVSQEGDEQHRQCSLKDTQKRTGDVFDARQEEVERVVAPRQFGRKVRNER